MSKVFPCYFSEFLGRSRADLVFSRPLLLPGQSLSWLWLCLHYLPWNSISFVITDQKTPHLQKVKVSREDISEDLEGWGEDYWTGMYNGENNPRRKRWSHHSESEPQPHYPQEISLAFQPSTSLCCLLAFFPSFPFRNKTTKSSPFFHTEHLSPYSGVLALNPKSLFSSSSKDNSLAKGNSGAYPTRVASL